MYPDKVPKLVMVSWVDAQTIGGAGWMENDEAHSASQEKLPIMLTVGFVLHEDDKQISLTSTIGPSETAQVNKIPKQMVMAVEDIVYG